MAIRIGNYDLIEQLGKGPHGQVQLAVDTVRDRMAALKFFRSLEAASKADEAGDFQERVLAFSHIESPYFATIYGVSRPTETPYYVAREYVNGITLQSLRHHCPTLARTFCAAIMHGVASGIAAVHARDRVHGNLKLSNVMLQQAGGVKVLDPNLAGPLLARSITGMNLTTGLFGSPVFMAPEQLAGGRATAATDAYAFGIMAYLLVCGRYPFEEPDLGRLRRLKLQGSYPAPQKLRPNLPTPITQVIEDSLRREPEHRTTSLAELAGRIEAWLSHAGTTPAQALLEGAQSVSYVFVMSAVASSQPDLDSAAVAEVTQPEQTSSPIHTAPPGGSPSGVSHPVVAAPPGLNPTSYKIEDSPLPGPLPERKAAPAGPGKTAPNAVKAETGPTPHRVADPEGATSGGPLPAVLFAPDAPIPAAPSATSVPSGSTPIRGYLVAAAAVIAVAVFWGVFQGEKTATEEGHGETSEKARALGPAELIERARRAADGDPSAALEAAERAVEALPESGEARTLLARAAIRGGDYPLAIENLGRARALLKESVEPDRLLVELHLERGANAEAEVAARAALKNHGTDARLYVLLARAELAERRLDDAIETLATATQLDPEEPTAWTILGDARSKKGDHLGARNAYQRAIELAPSAPAAYLGLGRALLALGHGGQATELLRRGLEVVPDSQELHYAVGRLFLRDGNHAEASKHLTTYVERYTGDWRGHFSLGLSRLRSGAHVEAVAAFRSAIAHRPNQPETHHDMGLALTRVGDDGSARKAFSDAIKLRYNLWQSHCERARLSYRLSRVEEARVGFEQTARLNPDCAVAKAVLAAPAGSSEAHLLLGLPCAATPDLDITD